MASLSKFQPEEDLKSREAVTEISEVDIASRIRTHRADIFKCLNPVELACPCIQSGLLHIRDLDFYLNESISRRKKIQKLLSSLRRKGSNAYLLFLRCIQQSEDHMGHTYIASLLEGQYFADKWEIEESATFGRQIVDNMEKLMDIDLTTLCPLLLSKRLITNDELKSLTNIQQPQKEKVLHFFQILDTKGPTAHSIFVHCLGEEDSHTTHREIFELISGPRQNQCLSKRKKGIGEADAAYESPNKRIPNRLTMHGALSTEKYAQTVRSWRSWVSNGKWDETERAEQRYIQMQCKQQDMKIAVLLQSAIGRIFSKEYSRARQLLKLCERLCSNVEGNNRTFLLGRCKYTWSWLYRYLKKSKKSKKYARDAMEILFNVEPGEDKALANYGYASILVDCLAISPDPETMKQAESALQFAISYAGIEDRGLEHIAPHSHLRLAQMYLGSTHYEPGNNTDPESIRKASDCLKAVDLRAIPPRSGCIFFLTESDLYRCKGDFTKARCSAMRALQMAQENNFQTEITSAETKIKSLPALT